MSVLGRLRAGRHAPRATTPPLPTPGPGPDGASAHAADRDRPVRRVTAALVEGEGEATAAAGARAAETVVAAVLDARRCDEEVHLALDLRGLDLGRREAAASVAAAVAALWGALHQRDALPDLWLTLVEPWTTLIVPRRGAADTDAPPWLGDPLLVTRAHHACLAHGEAARVLRAQDPDVRIGMVLDLAVHVAADEDRGADLDVVHAADLVRNHLLVGPLLEGALPVELVRESAGRVDWSVVRPGDLPRIRVRPDVLALTPPETWVLEGRPHPALLDGLVEARRAAPDDAARALHDQLRAFDVAHEGTALLVDLSRLPDAGGLTRDLALGAVADAQDDGIGVRVIG